MIGISVLIVFLLWLVVAVWLSWRIPQWLRVIRHTKALSVILFPVVLVLPVADELIGRWQFNRLCEKEAVVWLSPEWEKVKRAYDNDASTTDVYGYVIPIKAQPVEFVDADTKLPLLSYKGFHTKGGLLMRHGLGLDGITSCWPKEKTQLLNQLNIDQLLKQGE